MEPEDLLILNDYGRECAAARRTSRGEGMNPGFARMLLDETNYPVVFLRYDCGEYCYRWANGKSFQLTHDEYFSPYNDVAIEEFTAMLP